MNSTQLLKIKAFTSKNNPQNGSDAAEQLKGSNGDDSIFGLAGNDTLLGLAGNDLLMGGDGQDTLNGSLGNDTLDGGTGTDNLIGGYGSDTYILSDRADKVIEPAKDGDVDSIEIAISFTLPNNVEVLHLTGSLAINGVGNDLANRLEGNDAANRLNGNDGDDSLNGNAGDDNLIGGAGNNNLDGGDDSDTAIFSGRRSDYKLSEDPSDGTISVEDLRNADTDKLHNIENIRFIDVVVDITDGLPQIPCLSVADVSQMEGDKNNNVVFSFKLSQATSKPVTVGYSTLDGDALAGQDYVARTGIVTFKAGETNKTVAVSLIGDKQVETNEQFFLQLSSAVGVTLDSSKASATLLNDDVPILAITGTTLLEANSDKSNASITVILTAASQKTVTVNYNTVNATAMVGNDYTQTSGILSFAAGEISKTINVPVIGDSLYETDETFRVILFAPINASLSNIADATVTISNDDALILPTLAIAGATVIEGNSGTSIAAVTVTLSAISTQAVTVIYTTTDGTASSGSDYSAATGTLSFAVGETSKIISIPILADSTLENDETFTVALSLPTNGVLDAISTALVTISNDDPLFDGLDISLSDAANNFTGTADNDRIFALGDNDTISGGEGNDYLDGGNDNDSLIGDAGNDSLYGGLGNDTLDGYGENNAIENTADWLEGGDGDDELAGDATDTLLAGAGNDRLRGEALLQDGGVGDDYISYYGNDSKATLSGGDGNDSINNNYYSGANTLDGGAGNDTLSGGDNSTLIGGVGIDSLKGNDGDNFFIFAATDSGVGTDKRDIITDFNAASTLEVIDLSAVFSGVLTYIDSAAFSEANQLRYSFDVTANITIVQLNLDSDATTTEMEIQLTGLVELSATDFVL